MISNTERFASAVSVERFTLAAIDSTEAAEQGYILEQAMVGGEELVNWRITWIY